MPNFLDAPELLPLPSLRTYTSISVLLLSAALYYSFSVTSDQNWKQTSAYGFTELLSDEYTSHEHNGIHFTNDSGFEFEEYFESLLKHYQMDDAYKEIINHPNVMRLFDVALIMVNEPLCVWTLINMCYCILILVGKGIQKLIFGPLRTSEQQLVRDKFWNFLIYKFIFVCSVINVQYMDELILWCGWFSILGFMLVLTYLCKERFNYLAFSPFVSKWAHARLLTLLVFIAISTIPLFVLGFIVGYSANFSIGVFLVSEALLLCLRAIYCIALYCVHLFDLHRETPWENRATVNYYVQLVFDLIILSIEFCHHLHMLFWSNIISVTCLVIVIQLRSLYSEISQRVRKHRNYLQVLKLLKEQFSVATKEDLEKNNDDCAICWEPMTKARKLPCGHLFHTNCLRSWLEQDTSCPTCRSSLRQGNTNNAQNEAPFIPDAAIHNHFFHFDGSRYARWLPTVSVELRGANAMDININASIGRQDFLQRTNENQQVQANQQQQQQHPQSNEGPQTSGERPLFDGRQQSIEEMSRSVREFFPQISMQIIRDDLNITRSVELTLDNIIEGRVWFTDSPLENDAETIHNNSPDNVSLQNNENAQNASSAPTTPSLSSCPLRKRNVVPETTKQPAASSSSSTPSTSSSFASIPSEIDSSTP